MRKRALRFGDRLQPVARLGDHVDLGLALEHGPHGLPEQGVPIRQEHADRSRGFAQATLSSFEPGERENGTETAGATARTGKRSVATSFA